MNFEEFDRVFDRLAVSTWGLLWAAATVAGVTGLASSAYQAYATQRDRRRFPPPGRLVEIDGRRLHLWAAGNGHPSVVVVPALGAPAVEWATVQRALAQHTAVYLYDRGGLGWSDEGRWPRTVAQLTKELHRLLEEAQVPPPYVLVGHSLGGLVTRLYAAQHPERMAALVLVDASHPEMFRRGIYGRAGAATYWLRALRSRLAPVGLLRLAHDLELAQPARRDAEQACPRDLVPARIAFEFDPKQRRTDAGELLAFSDRAIRVCADTRLGDLPLTVISRGRQAFSNRRHESIWQELQSELPDLSTNSVQLVAQHAGHHVHRDDPDLVIDAIRRHVDTFTATDTPDAMRRRWSE